MSDPTQTLAAYLRLSVVGQPAEIKQATEFICNQFAVPGLAMLLLRLMQTAGLEAIVFNAAAVQFKNLIKERWVVHEGEVDVIGAAERQQIKSVIVDMMLAAPGSASQKVLAETLYLISAVDFPFGWDTLLPDLVRRLQTPSAALRNGVLKSIHSILRRYRHVTKSVDVLRELQQILAVFQEPFLAIFLSNCEVIAAAGDNADVLREAFTGANLLLKILYSLCSVDVPAHIEENLDKYMPALLGMLQYQVPPGGAAATALLGADEDEPGVLHYVQASVCDFLNLLVEKLDNDEYEKYLPVFVQAVWTMLMAVGAQPKLDPLVIGGIRFLNSLLKSSLYAALFNNEQALKSICERVVIPNMMLRQQDIEMFAEDWEQFVQRDIEGSDTDTRRRTACELVKGLRAHFEVDVTNIFKQYVDVLLSQYAADPVQNWRTKDVTVFLVTALAVTTSTMSAGAVQTNALVPVVQFFTEQIAPEFINAHSPVLQADALKFATTFRAQLPKETGVQLLPAFTALLCSPHLVVATYAANALERFLMIKDVVVTPAAAASGQAATTVVVPRYTRDDLKSVLPQLMDNLFKLLARRDATHNEYAMRALMRVAVAVQSDVAPFLDTVMQQLTLRLTEECKNPKAPQFNHYLFETIGVLIKAMAAANPAVVAVFEQLLFPPFQVVLQNDIVEFSPYVFQLLSFMLEMAPAVSPAYLSMLPNLLSPALWERRGNIPAMVRLLQAFLRKASAHVATAQGVLSGILGVAALLIPSPAQDHEGFYLLEAVVEHTPRDALQQYVAGIFGLIFNRLSSNKTTKFVKGFLVFLALFIYKQGAEGVVTLIDGMQGQLFLKVLESLWLPHLQKISGLIERKLAVIAAAMLLTQSPQMLAAPYVALWPQVLEGAVKMLEVEEDTSSATGNPESELDIDDRPGYSVGYSQLAFASKANDDPAPEIADAKAYLALSLHTLSKQVPGRLGPMIAALPFHSILQTYFAAANVPQPYLA